MTHWWIIDCRHQELLHASQKWLAMLSCPKPEHQPDNWPDHLLLLGCAPETAIDVRKRISEKGSEIKIHALLAPRLEAFNKAPENWLQICLHRLFQKHAATSIEIHPAQASDKMSLKSGPLLRSYEPTVASVAKQKPSLAFVSPLPPSQTGIAAYSEELLHHLGIYYDLTLVVERSAPELTGDLQKLPWLTAEAFKSEAAGFDRIVYQIGNSLYHAWQFEFVRLYPGLVVLHDYYLFDAVWWQEKAGIKPHALRYGLYEGYGYPAVVDLDAKNKGRGPEKYPVNGEIINEAAGLVVHSRHAMALHRRWYPQRSHLDVSVIPHLRKLPQRKDRTAARRALNISDQALVIASFGNMNPKKGVDRIVSAFLNTAFSQKELLLVFAGSEHIGEFGRNLRRILKGHPRGSQVVITGYLSNEKYRSWLEAADIAVQLRTMTRGESSGAVLDAMSHGLPLITNAHGSSSELPRHAVFLLPEDPSEILLQEAMAELASSRNKRLQLGRNAQDWVRHHHDPDTVSAFYHKAIEKSVKHPVMQQKRWLDQMAEAAQGVFLADDQLENISKSIQQMQLLHPSSQPRILFDISILAWHDQKTGIERVTREIAIQLLKNPPQGYRCELIRWQGDDFRLAADYASELLHLAHAPAYNRPVEACAEDIYLTLEWAPPLLQQAADVFLGMKARGVRFVFTVHDLLPLFLPQCFPDGTEQKMRDWFQRITYLADGLLCVSAHVAETVMDQLEQLPTQNRPAVEYFHPGADFSRPSHIECTKKERRLLKKIDRSPRPRLLMVGTLEPRKGHHQVLDAAEFLWRRNQQVTLVFAGKEGKEVRSLIARLKNHPQNGRQLFWCNAASDDFLHRLYRLADSLVAASLGEGFGLPLIEAAYYHLPILARDIPVFKEVAGSYARYFHAKTGEGLAEDIATWIEDWRVDSVTPAFPLSYNSWADSAEQLKKALFQSLLPATRKGEKQHAEDNTQGGWLQAGSSANVL